jgi:hypothetical protein
MADWGFAAAGKSKKLATMKLDELESLLGNAQYLHGVC